MKALNVLKVGGTVCQIIGAIGGIAIAGFEIGKGVNELKDFQKNQNNDSVAHTNVDVVEVDKVEVEA